ncbi:hypothetical protein AX774_g2604 [Zancudomyces culisetae]|uniref:Uncharacterized protein n=1 Tax=Zancudomyces culisetae TaxID=1213189 RepID=A0A1R1PSI4_ZANCU|nr:hypothetical protein AX774_g2604 [Zancudomyces culisetae]|eukprot:OMH83889.1 hypothetical protein AX774_g2604 [Zancudomyces culisetae]
MFILTIIFSLQDSISYQLIIKLSRINIHGYRRTNEISVWTVARGSFLKLKPIFDTEYCSPYLISIEIWV